MVAAIGVNGSTLFLDPRFNVLPRFLVQVFIVLVVTRVLGRVLRRFKFPTVIGEIAAGIILGPSALGQLPGWTDSIFPAASLPFFSLVANLGLMFFMFFLGLELDPTLMKRQWKQALPIALSAIIFPFLCGSMASYWLYDVNGNDNVDRLAFILFLGAAMSFTAFPVLASILQSSGLLGNPLGVLAISCAAIDDVTAWCVLAIASSFARSSDAVQGIYTTLIAIGYVLFMFFVVRPVLVRINDHFHAKGKPLHNSHVIAVFLSLLMSAFLAESIGIHAFFGSFLSGILVPKKGRFVHELAPKVQLLCVDFFLPLYFTNSGLSTYIPGINSSFYGGVTVFLVVLASVAKFTPSFLMTRLVTRREWSYCAVVGVLMNTRGLVELIVLNIGLDLNILSTRLFTMLVIMAITTTCMTPPLLHLLYMRFQTAESLDKERKEFRMQAYGQSNTEATSSDPQTEHPGDATIAVLATTHPADGTVDLDEDEKYDGVASIMQGEGNYGALPAARRASDASSTEHSQDRCDSVHEEAEHEVPRAGNAV